MNEQIFSWTIQALGFMGLMAIGMIPMRGWRVLRRAYRECASGEGRARWLIGALTTGSTVAVLWLDITIIVRIFKCLTETYCGPGVASGWGYLAMLGLGYLAYELFLTLGKAIAQFHRYKASN